MARLYKVWVKGLRCTTERNVAASNKQDAIFIYARTHDCKTYMCDAMWQRV